MSLTTVQFNANSILLCLNPLVVEATDSDKYVAVVLVARSFEFALWI
jgi:hypothetical protein